MISSENGVLWTLLQHVYANTIRHVYTPKRVIDRWAGHSRNYLDQDVSEQKKAHRIRNFDCS